MTRADAAKRSRVILICASLTFLIGMAVIVTVLLMRAQQRAEVTLRICRSQIAQNAVLRSVLVESKRQSLLRARNEAQINRIEAAYMPLLHLVPPLECDPTGRPTTRR